MIMWNKLDPKTTLVEVIGIPKGEKTAVTLAGALDALSKAKGVEYPSNVGLWGKKILTMFDGKKIINTFTVKDANHIFGNVVKNENEATAYRTRSTLINAIRYAITGKLKEPKPQAPTLPDGSPNGDIGKLKFSVAELAEVTHLIPLYTTTGRFGYLKAEVQKMIYSLKEGQVGIVEAPKRSMTQKEAKAMLAAVSSMFSKGKLPWTIKYNLNESTFILIRQADLDKLINKNKKGA